MTGLAALTPAMEAAIVGQQAVLACSLASRVRRGGRSVQLLAAIFGSCGLMMVVNLATGGRGPLGDLNLALDLLVPAEIYLYVSAVRVTGRPLRRVALVHVVPAFVGVLAWKTGVVASMDGYGLACWGAYLGAALVVLGRRWADFTPASRGVVATLLGSFVAMALLRVPMAIDHGARPFREGWPYQFLLAVALAMTSRMLLAALRRPELLFAAQDGARAPEVEAPGRVGAPTAEEDALIVRLTALLETERPYLDPDLTLAQLAARLGASQRNLSRVVNARHAMTFSAFMNYHRALAAARLLRDPAAADVPIKNVMYASGFRSKSAFHREFRRHFGVSASAYRADTPPEGK
jgi:AraC-like DNA-binding protein